MEILLTRHGQTEWNLLKKLQSKTNIELNETGVEQAKKIKEKLKNTNIDIIICSPLKRAIQTAEIINEERNLPIILDNRISERDFGEFEGKFDTEFDLDSFWNYKQNVMYNRAENISDFFNRIYSFLNDIQEKYKEKRILIVSHLGVSIPIRCYFEGMPNIDVLLPLGINKDIPNSTVKII